MPILRVDGPLYTADVRSAGRLLLAAVDAAAGTRVLVVDASAVPVVTVTVLQRVAELDRELGLRGIEPWIAAVPESAAAAARHERTWRTLADEHRLHPTALAAVRAFDG